MLNYKLKDEDVEKICKKYELSKSEFGDMRDSIGTFYTKVRFQHLSSVMRYLEIYGRYVTRNNNFRIDWDEMPNNSNDSHSLFDLKKNRFIILLEKEMDDDVKARYIVAHELGYLFYILKMIEKTPKTKDEIEMLWKRLEDKALHAELHRKSNVFGVLIILERCEFYKNKVISSDGIINKTMNESLEDVMNHFN